MLLKYPLCIYMILTLMLSKGSIVSKGIYHLIGSNRIAQL